MLSDALLGTFIYTAAVSGDVYSSRKALSECRVCYESNGSFNTGRPVPALITSAGLGFVDYKLSKSKSQYAKGVKWGLRIGIAALYGFRIKQNLDAAKH
jgi:hypothetical protein